VSLFFNVHKAPLNDPAVRKAVSFGINRQQLSTQAETGYELPITSTTGLLLPSANSYLEPSLANNLPSGGDPSTVSKTLTADGYTKVNGKWTKDGHKISFSISDPIPYSDYYTGAQMISHQLNALGFDVTVDGISDPSVWAGNLTNGKFDSAIHWSNQGPTPYQIYDNWLDFELSAPIGQAAAGDLGRFQDPAAQDALNAFAQTGDPAAQRAAVVKLEKVMDAQTPVAPLLTGADWYEFSTKNYTGWPSSDNPYMNPTPNSPYILETVLHLTPAT
jgi:peptide/nickel transport system substrate-binding protein